MEEWISLNEYCKRYKMGYATVINMINNNEVEFKKTPNGYYKIKVGGNMVSRELFEEEHRKRIEAEKTIELIKKMLEVKTND